MTAAFFATHNYRSEATELNSLGTARADQQMLKLAAEKVAEAYSLDPNLAIAEISQGIALFYRGESSEAQLRIIDCTMSLAGCSRLNFHAVLPHFSEKVAAGVRR